LPQTRFGLCSFNVTDSNIIVFSGRRGLNLNYSSRPDLSLVIRFHSCVFLAKTGGANGRF
jgi:hypothetical protein